VNSFFYEFFKDEDKPIDGAVPVTIVANVDVPFQRAIIDSSSLFY
jgi:hypothetical protein